MLTVTVLLVSIAAVAILTRTSAATPLHSIERFYLIVMPIPVLVAFVLPGAIGSLIDDSAGTRPGGVRLSAAGGWLSLAWTIGGVVLLAQRHAREDGWDRRLLLGLLVAALPVLLIGLVASMYALI